MNLRIFNACLLAGWLMLMLGVGLTWSLGVALVIGGVVLMGVTLLLAFRSGVVRPKPEEGL